MTIDLSRFKVVYGNKVLNALALVGVDFGDIEASKDKCVNKPRFITILAINEDGNIVEIHDESWMFQFIPIINGGRHEKIGIHI